MTDHYEIVIQTTDSQGNTVTSEALNMAAANAPTVADAVKVATGILVTGINGGLGKVSRAQERKTDDNL